MGTQEATSKIKGDFSERVTKLLVRILSLFFVTKLVVLAFSMPPGVAPDELYQIHVIDLFRQSITLFPFNASSMSYPRALESFSAYGNAVEYPYLYHLVMSWAVSLVGETYEFRSIVFMRLLNVLLACGHCFVLYRLVLAIPVLNVTRVLAFAIVTNLFMFTYVSSAISYDNLLNLCATLSVYLLIRWIQIRRLELLCMLLAVWALGALTKMSILPLALFEFLVIARFLLFRGGRVNKIEAITPRCVVSILVGLALVGLALEFYAGNVLQ